MAGDKPVSLPTCKQLRPAAAQGQGYGAAGRWVVLVVPDKQGGQVRLLPMLVFALTLLVLWVWFRGKKW